MISKSILFSVPPAFLLLSICICVCAFLHFWLWLQRIICFKFWLVVFPAPPPTILNSLYFYSIKTHMCSHSSSEGRLWRGFLYDDQWIPDRETWWIVSVPELGGQAAVGPRDGIKGGLGLNLVCLPSSVWFYTGMVFRTSSFGSAPRKKPIILDSLMGRETRPIFRDLILSLSRQHSLWIVSTPCLWFSFHGPHHSHYLKTSVASYLGPRGPSWALIHRLIFHRTRFGSFHPLHSSPSRDLSICIEKL